MPTKLILDDGFRTLDLIGAPPEGIYLGPGPDSWVPPLPTYEGTYAEGADSEGRRKVRERAQNGQGSAKGYIGSTLESNFWNYADDLQEMVESVRRQKGSLRYEPQRNGTPVTFDLETISVSGLPQNGVHLDQLHCEWELAFETLPYGRLDTVNIFTGQSLSGPIDSIDIDSIPGHLSAWPELRFTDSSGQTRGHVEVAIQDDYSPSAPEPLLLNLASGLTVAAYSGASATRSGSYSANVARATLTGSPVTVCATTPQLHKGLWVVRARVYPSTGDVRLRLAWKVGDGPITTERWVDVPAGGNFFDLHLETIDIGRLEPDHSWTGYIDAYATSGSPTIDIDDIELMPGKIYGKSRSPNPIATPSAFSASDSFPSTGTLTGKALSGGGGNWTLVSGSDADPFNVIAGGIVECTSTSDAPSGNLYNSSEGLIGRAEYASGPSVSDLFAQIDFSVSALVDGVAFGHWLRFVDDQNFVFIRVAPDPITGTVVVQLYFAAGSGLGADPITAFTSLTANAGYTLSVFLNASGNYSIWFTPVGAALGTPLLQSSKTGLPSSGKCGIFDSNFTATPCTRHYRNYRLWVPSTNAAIYGGRSARFLHDTALRESSNGSQEGRVPVFEGQHLEIPPGTRAGLASRLVAKFRRLDVDSGQPDTGLTDSALAELNVTPRVVFLSRGGIVGFPVYTLSNITTDHGFNANTTNLNELANNLGTLIGEYPLPVGVWSNTNVTADRTLNANTATAEKLADVLGTLCADLQLPGPHPPYSITNVTQRRILNATTITPEQFADVLGTFINDLTAIGDL